MAIRDEIRGYHDLMTGWRRDIHKHPETAFEEFRTADKVAELLESFGIEVHRGLAKTGVVGTLKAGPGPGPGPGANAPKAIGLRADLDALHIEEMNEFDHRSVNPGKMHACGHDGHTTMLLGAAKYLAETRNFDGTVQFIFQPAEENEAGGRAMVQDGLFDLFPVDAVYGMHNFPGIEAGRFAMREGPQMASADFFEAVIRGVGGHAAFPHTTRDPIPAAAQIITAWQTIVSRETDPLRAAVLTVTQIHAGHTTNVIPAEAHLSGTVRAFDGAVQDAIEESMARIATGVAEGFGLTAEWHYDRRYPATVNTGKETEIAARAATDVVGAEAVDTATGLVMGSEDFAWMLREKPGCYVLLGNGTGGEGGCVVHNPNYDFNDAILPIGASYWVQLVENELPSG